MPAVSGRTVHTAGGQNITTTRRKGTKVTVPRGTPLPPAPAGGSSSHISGRPGAGIVATRVGGSGVTTYRASPSKGLSSSQVRKMNARAQAARQAEVQRRQLVTQAQHNLAKLAKPKIIHQLNKAGTISGPKELKMLKAAAPHVVLHYGNRFNPEVVHNVLHSIGPSLPNLPRNQKPKTRGGPSKGLRRPPGGSKSDIRPSKAVRHLVKAGAITPKQAKKITKRTAKLTPGGKAPKGKKKILVPTGAISKEAQTFAGVVAKKTKLDPRVVAAWMKLEQNTEASGASTAGPGNQDWLGVAFPGHRTTASQNPKFWSDPVTAGKTTAKWIKGWSLPDYGTAVSGIQNIGAVARATKNPAKEAAAIAASGWGTTTDPSSITSGVSSYGVARKKVKGVKGGGGGIRDVKITKNGPLVHPFPQATLSRTDQGKDATGTGPIRAMADAKVVSVNNMGWPNGGAGPSGQNVTYKMTSGPLAGTAHDTVAVAEGITPSVKAGQKVKKGQPIGTFYPGSSIEQLFVGPDGQALTPYAGAADGTPMPAGIMMANIIEGKTIKLGRASGGAVPTASTGSTTGATSAAPVSTAAASSARTPSGFTVTKTGVRVKSARQRAADQAQALAERRRRAVLHSAITALGKTTPLPKAAAPTSASAPRRKITLGLG